MRRVTIVRRSLQQGQRRINNVPYSNAYTVVQSVCVLDDAVAALLCKPESTELPGHDAAVVGYEEGATSLRVRTYPLEDRTESGRVLRHRY